MRILGAVFIFSAFALYGIFLARGLMLRAMKLESAICYINAVTEQIRITRAEISQVLAQVESTPLTIKNGEWQGTSGLKTEDIRLLNTYLSQLGKTDLEGQMESARLCIAAIEQRLENAKRDSEKSRLYISLYALIGLFAAVLII